MGKVKSVKFNFIMNFILTLSNILFPLVTFPYVSRILLPVGTGRISFVTSVVTYFTLFGMLGVANYGIRQCAKVRDDKVLLSKTVQEIFILNSIAMAISTTVYIIAIMTVPRFAEDRTLFMINILTLLFTLLGVQWVYKALEQYQYIAIRSILFKVLSIIAMFLLVKQQSDVITYGAITAAAAVGSNLFNFINLRKMVTIQKHERLDVMQHLKPTLNFFFLAIATVIYTNLDVVTLGFIHGNDSVGYYNAAVKIKSVLVTLVTSLGAVLLPRLSYYVQNKHYDEFKRLTQKSMHFILVSAVSMSVYFMFFAQQGIAFLSGNGYEQAVLPMIILMPTLVFIGLSNLIGIQIMVPMGNEKLLVRSVCFGALADITMNIFLVPTYGVVGAALGNLTAELVVVLYQMYCVRDLLKNVVDKRNIVKILGSIALAQCVLPFVPKFSSLFITLAVSSSIYFGVVGIVLVIMKEKFVSELMSSVIKKMKK